MTDAILGGWQFNANQTIQSGLPFDVSYAAPAPTATRVRTGPNVIGDIKINGGQDQWFNTTPIGAAGSAFARRRSARSATWSATR